MQTTLPPRLLQVEIVERSTAVEYQACVDPRFC
jgi:hypothetical protein